MTERLALLVCHQSQACRVAILGDKLMIRAGMVGLGKMGISHYAILNAHPDVDMVAITDTNTFITSALKKHSKTETFKDYKKMIDQSQLDCVLIATPTKTHFEIAQYALEAGLAVFLEKPFTLTLDEGRALVELAARKQVVNQVGYHNHFVGTFAEVRRLVRAQVLGNLYNIVGEAYGQVVTKPKTSTWRSKKSEGGGCLHDYASHVLDLMNWVVGVPRRVLGAVLQPIYSEHVEDAVYAAFDYENGMAGQLTTNWSDTAYRKMTTRISLYGEHGKIIADRQEIKVFLRPGQSFEDYGEGWTTKYITGLQKPVWYYLRGEEYSAQIDSFITAIKNKNFENENSFVSAYRTDQVIDMIQRADRIRS